MDSSRVDMFIATMGNRFPGPKLMLIKDRLERIDDSRMIMIQSMDYKDPNTMLLISIFLGTFGVDRFMLGDTGMGILKLLTAGVCGVLTIIDWCTITERTKEKNFQTFMSVA